MKEDEFFAGEERGNEKNGLDSLHLLVDILSLRGILLPLLPVRLSVASSSTYTTNVVSSFYALTRPSSSPFLFEPYVTTMDEGKADERRQLGSGPKGGRREERTREK